MGYVGSVFINGALDILSKERIRINFAELFSEEEQKRILGQSGQIAQPNDLPKNKLDSTLEEIIRSSETIETDISKKIIDKAREKAMAYELCSTRTEFIDKVLDYSQSHPPIKSKLITIAKPFLFLLKYIGHLLIETRL